MSEKPLSQSVVSKIKSEKIEPRPSWHFMLMNFIFWMVFASSVLVGARVLGVLVYVFSNIDLGLLFINAQKFSSPLFSLLPYAWIFSFVGLLFLASLGLHKTSSGYKMSITKLIGLNLLISLVLGLFFFATGDGRAFEQSFSFLPGHKPFEQRRGEIWLNPESGRFAGVIVSIKDDEVLVLDDLTGKEWMVQYSAAELRGDIELVEGERIRILGSVDGDMVTADIISSWKPPKPGKRPRKQISSEKMKENRK